MRYRDLLAILALAQVAACSSGSKDSASTSSTVDDKKSDDKKADKKKGDKKKDADDKGDGKAKKDEKADATAKADASSAPAKDPEGSGSAAPSAGPPSGLAGIFTGDIDPAVKFERQGQVPNKPVWMQIVPYWKLNLDTPPDEEPYKDLVVVGNSEHATIYLWTQKHSADGISAVDQSNHCMWVHIPDCKFDPPVDGVVGQGIKVKISEGKGTMMTKPARLWWMLGDIEGGEQLAVFIGLRTDVYPKLEDDLKAMLKSLKIQHG